MRKTAKTHAEKASYSLSRNGRAAAAADTRPLQCPSSSIAAGGKRKEGVERQFPLAQVVTHAQLAAAAECIVHRACYYNTRKNQEEENKP